MKETPRPFSLGKSVNKWSCPATRQSSNVDEHSVSPITKQQLAEVCSFGQWMMVERKQRKPFSKQNDPSNKGDSNAPMEIATNFLQGSRFNFLSDATNGDSNAPAIPSEPLVDVPIHQVRSTAPRAKLRSKGKMHVSSKPVKSVSLRKTLVFNFADFPVLARNPNRASNSNIPLLDPTKHMVVVVDENLDPNIGVLPATSPMSDHTPPIGKPPDTQTMHIPVLDSRDQADISSQAYRIDDVNLLIDLENLLDQEELLWKQKSRFDWINHGDRNTSYFHRRAICRKQKNRISALTLPNGDWCDDDLLLQQEPLRYFFSLFSCADVPVPNFPICGVFPPIDGDLMRSLNSVPSDQEIHDALMEMALLKSPSWDGLHAEFFQKKWNIVGPSVC
ncbi:hypothetical protein GQ457_03G013250 [Hibiscus cannabinus]